MPVDCNCGTPGVVERVGRGGAGRAGGSRRAAGGRLASQPGLERLRNGARLAGFDDDVGELFRDRPVGPGY